MGVQSVFKKCTAFRNDEELEKITSLLLANIEKHKDKFEKATYTYWNESESMAMWNMIADENQTPTQAKRAYFEEHKEELVHKYLTVLCDLFDYEVK